MGASVAKLQVSYLNSKLLGAVRRNDAQETEYYVRAGADPNAFTDDTEVQEQYLNLRLRRAVMQNDAQETEYYLRAGADPNAFTARDRPLTSPSCFTYYDETELPPILLLLTTSTWRWTSDDTPLDCLRLLLDYGTDIDISTSRCPPPLLVACEHNLVSAVRLLIERGAAVNVFHEEVTYPQNPAYTRHSSTTPLFSAIRHACEKSATHARGCGSTEVISLLLDQGAEVNISLRCYGSLCPPLGFAISRGHAGVLRLLLEHGADVEAGWNHPPSDRKGPWRGPPLPTELGSCEPPLLTILHDFHLQFDNQCRILKMLLSYGANILRPVPINYTDERCAPLAFVRGLETWGETQWEGPIYDTYRVERINIIFDAAVLARCIVAGRRYEHFGSARYSLFAHPYLPSEIAEFLGFSRKSRGLLLTCPVDPSYSKPPRKSLW